MAALIFFKAALPAVAQEDSPAKTYSSTNGVTNTLAAANETVGKKLLELRLGPFDLHPRLTTGLSYNDDLTYATSNKEADAIWTIRPAFQAVAGDDAALIGYRDQNYDVLNLSPGTLVIQQPEARPGKLLILDYGPGFEVYDRYSTNNSTDEFATLNLLWPMNKLILGLKQDYQLQKEPLIQAEEFATVETISTALSAAYQFGEKTSVESNFRRVSIGYDEPGLTGDTEYNTEDWFNYEAAEDLPVSLGVLAGQDEVANHQDQSYEQLRARARYSYTEKIAFDVSVGGELRQYQNGKSATLSPVFTISGSYRPTERTLLSLTGYRQQYASIYNGFNYASTGATLGVRQGITDRFSAGVSAGYYDLDFTSVSGPSSTHSDGYYTARMSLDTKIARHLTSQIFYQWTDRQSQYDGDMNENQAGVQLILSY
ncbi:MAG: hypothetical protein ABSF38_02120 [Verrucomicrobiota bacterium]|jgi:hypothetical protein